MQKSVARVLQDRRGSCKGPEVQVRLAGGRARRPDGGWDGRSGGRERKSSRSSEGGPDPTCRPPGDVGYYSQRDGSPWGVVNRGMTPLTGFIRITLVAALKIDCKWEKEEEGIPAGRQEAMVT